MYPQDTILVNKVDSNNNFREEALDCGDIGAVSITGSNLTGFLTLHADPTSSGHAATKQYVDNQVSEGVVVGSIDSQTRVANGATITGGALYLQTANASYPGLLSTGNQTIAGIKSFSSNPQLLTVSGAGASVLTTDVNGYISSESHLTSGRGGTGLSGSIGYRILYGDNSSGWTTNSGFTFDGSNLSIPNSGTLTYNGAFGSTRINGAHRIDIDGTNNAITIHDYGTIYFKTGSAPGTTIAYIDSNGVYTNNLRSGSTLTLYSANGDISNIEAYTNGTRRLGVTNTAVTVYAAGFSAPAITNTAVGTYFYIYGTSQEVRVQPVNGNDWTCWIFGTTGIFTPCHNNAQDIGVASNYRVQDIYVQGYVGPFTGCHIYKVMEGESLDIGDAVSIRDKQIVKTTTANETSCIGIVASNPLEVPTISGINSILTDSFNVDYDLSISGMDTRAVAALGDNTTGKLFGFKVCDEGGDIFEGTLLVTASGYPGYLKAQSDNIIRSSTVGKSLENVTFSGGKSHDIYGVIYCG